MSKIEILSSGKINLDLIIKGKRADGYHDISSLIQPIGLQDTLLIENTNSSKLIDLDFPDKTISYDDNLIIKAAQSFYEYFQISQAIKITVKKKIPLESGMGGGSSNAAATLLGLSKIFGIDDFKGLLSIGKELGSDVPFFLYSKTARISGKGEIVEIIENPAKTKYLLIFPGFGSSTKSLYSLWDQEKLKIKNYNKSIETKKISFDKKTVYLRNDFLPLLIERHKEYKEIFKILDELELNNYSISGSGSTIFSVLEDGFDTEEAEKYLESSMNIKAFTVNSIEGWRFLID